MPPPVSTVSTVLGLGWEIPGGAYTTAAITTAVLTGPPSFVVG
ncbi:hypothetical protein [Arthrobacter monumenti]